MNHCHRCLLPANVPGADLDRGRVGAFGRADTPAAKARNEALSRAGDADLGAALHAAGGQGPDHCLMCCLNAGSRKRAPSPATTRSPGRRPKGSSARRWSLGEEQGFAHSHPRPLLVGAGIPLPLPGRDLSRVLTAYGQRHGARR
jgi:hypothetical protein